MRNERVTLEVTYKDLPGVLDADIRACADVAGVRETGTGYHFPTGVRDLTFQCDCEDDAHYAAGILRSNLPERVKITLWT